MGTGHSWIDALDDGLAGQRRILRRLLEFCESHDEARWLAVSCSLARGAADRWSDVDAGLGVRAGTGAELAGELPDFLAQDAEITAVLRHVFGSAEKAVLRSFVQFADGTQLDLVLVDAASRPGRAPDEIVLADKDGRLAEPFVPSVDVVTPEQIHEWAFLGWTALADAAKYLRRGSFWEAHHRLHEVRERIWALWAAAKGARYPGFGLSQVLDRDPADLPRGIEDTVADLDPLRLRAALLASVAVLEETSRDAAARFGAELPAAMAEYVSDLWNRFGEDTE
jgi:predicted nucleotidyltransferase